MWILGISAFKNLNLYNVGNFSDCTNFWTFWFLRILGRSSWKIFLRSKTFVLNFQKIFEQQKIMLWKSFVEIKVLTSKSNSLQSCVAMFVLWKCADVTENFSYAFNIFEKISDIRRLLKSFFPEWWQSGKMKQLAGRQQFSRPFAFPRCTKSTLPAAMFVLEVLLNLLSWTWAALINEPRWCRELLNLAD